MYVKSFSFKYASCSKLIFRYASRVSNPQPIHLIMYSRPYSAKYTNGLTSTHHQEKRPTAAKRTAKINATICVSICCIPCIFSWLMSFTVRLRASFSTKTNGHSVIVVKPLKGMILLKSSMVKCQQELRQIRLKEVKL